MEYLDYSVEEFLADEQFQQWVLAPEEENQQFWENFLRTYPEKKQVVVQAREVLQSIVSKEIPPVEESRLDTLWQRIDSSRKQETTYAPEIPLQKPAKVLPLYTKIAAVFLGLLVSSFLMYLWLKPAPMLEYHTAFGKTKKIVLPDHSIVILNSNSTIRYASEWSTRQPREVWIEGEAYFSVIHTQNNQKFQVTTPSKMVVEVLGTQFNVKDRTSGAQVVLKDGKVKLLLTHTGEEKQVMMAPSEAVTLTKTASGYTKKRVDPNQYLSWTQHKLIFKNTPLAEIKTLLEETYGLTVKIPNESLLEQQISGSVPSDNIESLLFALSESFNYQIIQQNNQLLFLERTSK
ncbi:FecR domain-containing protein [Rhodocytophaga aerolata]|uniref:FecR domain-containing protein n=1 Tax=Rhodocytophaga aerolata TaxID=455078 RepID=A0ABT8R6A8_9BACT|nr:FecR domain-containing protein [Rhodocytophaga aerolata]MDO1446743.1 FecR domain-containing protein [Rhodocytophaga aerolata]